MTKTLQKKSIPTRGRSLDDAARIYDFCEPIVMLGRQEPYNRNIVDALNIQPQYRVLDLGCGTGVLTSLIANHVGESATGIGIMKMMIDLTKRENCTFIMATHDQDLISLADQSIRLRDGLTAPIPVAK